MKYDVKSLVAEIKRLEEDQRRVKSEFKTACRAVTAAVAQKKSWGECHELGRDVNRLRSWVGSNKHAITLRCMARASLRGRLHMTKQSVLGADGKLETKAWTLEEQAKAAAEILSEFELPENAEVTK